MIEFENYEADVANFLLTRGGHAWLGFGWHGCDLDYSAAMKVSYKRRYFLLFLRNSMIYQARLGTNVRKSPKRGVYTYAYRGRKAS